MSGRGFPVYVKCPMHGWTTWPAGVECQGCELCGQTRPECLWFTAKRHVQGYERDRREAAELARRQPSWLMFVPILRRQRR